MISIVQTDTVKSGRPFQVLASTGPLIILPGSYMNEVRNDDRMSFGGFLKKVCLRNFTTTPLSF